MMTRAMSLRHSFALVVAASSAAIVALLACGSSSDGGTPTLDAGVDATADTSVADASIRLDADAAEAAPCSDIPVADGDVMTMCLVQRCCSELTQCTNDCAAYKSCVIACSQMDAGPSCFDKCSMQHSNGEVQLHNLVRCGDQMCTPPGDR